MKQLTLFLFLCLTLSLNAQTLNKQDVNALRMHRQQNGVGFQPSLSSINNTILSNSSQENTIKDNYELRFVNRTLSRSNTNPNMTKIVIRAQASNDIGFQMLLDSSHTQYGQTIPSGFGTRLSTTDLTDSIYKLFSYTLPTVISGSAKNCLAIRPGTSDSTLIRPGTYDFAIIYPKTSTYQYGFWVINGNFARQNDFIFEAGYTYTFEIGNNVTVALLPPFDLETVKIILPQNGKLTNQESIGLQLRNKSHEVEVLDYHLMYQINGGSIITEKNKKSLAPNDTVNYFFTQKADFSNPGLYKIKAWVSFEKDLQRANDTLTAYCKHLEVLTLPLNEYFMSEDELQAHWNIIDANTDGNSWKRSPYLGVEGTGEINYNNNSNVADDYLISDPVSLPNQKLHLVFNYKNNSYSQSQKLTVLYGTSPDPSKMIILKKFDSIKYSDLTKMSITNFTPPVAGDYHFAFHTTSAATVGTLLVSNIVVDEGDYLRSPDLKLIDVVLPLSSCDLKAPQSIKMTLVNNGSENVNTFTIKIKINDSILVEQQGQFIAVGDTLVTNIYPWPTLDFSAKKLYQVSCIIDADRDLNRSDDTIHLRIHNYEPITEMPFSNYFTNTQNADNWHSEKPLTSSWVYDEGYKTYEGYNDSVHLISRCFTLEPGTYRFRLKYSAGFQLLTYSFYEYFKVSIGASNTDINTWDTFMRLDKKLGKELYATSYFTITEKNEYSFSIMTTDEDGLNTGISSIFGIDLEKVKEHDLFLNQFESTLSQTIPIEHLSVDPTFKAAIVNTGVQTQKNIKLEIKNGETTVASVVSDKTISLNDTLIISTVGKISNPSIGNNIELIATISMENEDMDINNNIKKHSFVVSDTILANDKVKELSNGVGNSSPISFGSIFRIAKTDTLTEVKVLVIESTSAQIASLAIYSLDSMMRISKKLIETDFKRAKDFGEISIKIPARIFEAGSYYFEINQKTRENIGIANDKDAEGIIYIHSNGKLNPDKSKGNIAIRPVFGHHANIFQLDAGVVQISKPKTNGVFSINEPIVARIQNYGTRVLTKLSVHCSLNGIELTPFIIDTVHPYSYVEVHFTADLSKVQTHVLEIWSNLLGDENPANDRAIKSVISKEMPSPYTLDFEDCEEFSITKLIPNWTTLDIDKEPTATLNDYTFKNAGKPASFIVFNPLLTTPPINNMPFLNPQQGNNYGASFSSYTKKQNDWLISPKLKLGSSSSLSLWVKSAQEGDGIIGDILDQYNILVSETDSEPNNFVLIGKQRSAPLEWENVIVDLNKYNNKDIYVAIQCVSQDVVMFLIDDIKVQTELDNIGVQASEKVNSISLYPNPATNYVNIYSPITDITSVEVYSLSGYLVYRSAPNLKHRSLRISTTSFSKGSYFIKVLTNEGVQTLKFVNL